MIPRAAVFLLCAASALYQSTSPEQQPYRDLVRANTRFAFKLFRAILEKAPETDVLVSPISVSQDFALLQNGADPTARKQILSVLEFGDLSAPEINNQSLALRQALTYDPPSKPVRTSHPKGLPPPPPMCCAPPLEKLTLAGSLWTVLAVSYRSEFLEINKKFYGFHVTPVPGKESSAINAVNDWVARQTAGQLNQAIDSWDRDGFAVVDTTWFKGAWAKPFFASQTHPGRFTLASGHQKRMPMMAQGGHFDYLRGPKFQAVRLPYGHAAMYVFLPDRDSSLKEFEESLTAENWSTWLSEISSKDGYLELPRFRSDYHESLTATLSALGMGRVFTNVASFRPLVGSPAGAELTRVLQVISIKVDENGTEAVSATYTGGVVGGVSGGPRPEPFRMIIDHPFFFAICDNQTGSILYMGAINDPMSSQSD
jgi:serine protease inhibitor